FGRPVSQNDLLFREKRCSVRARERDPGPGPPTPGISQRIQLEEVPACRADEQHIELVLPAAKTHATTMPVPAFAANGRRSSKTTNDELARWLASRLRTRLPLRRRANSILLASSRWTDHHAMSFRRGTPFCRPAS